MIRINLLPVRAAKKKESIRFQLTVAGLITFLSVAVTSAVYFSVRSEASGIAADITKGQQELESLKQKIGELSRIKEQKRVVEEKLNIIKSLEAGRTGPSNLFKKIGDAIPEKAWLTSMKDEGHVIVLKGYASSDEVVADLMRGLEKYRELGNVELDFAKRELEKETNTEVVSFMIRLERAMPPAQTKEKKK